MTVDAIDDAILRELEATVWRAMVTKAAHESQVLEVDLRVVCRHIREVQRSMVTVVVAPDFPATTYDFGFPAGVVRSSACPKDTCYIIPAAAELQDLLAGLR